MRKHIAKISSVFFLITMVITSNATATPSADQVKRLTMQHRLDYDAFLVDATWIGTHNSFNAAQSGYPIPNQKYTMIEQLNNGFRVLSYDLYNAFGTTRLCHAECSPSDDTLSATLSDLGNWLNANPDDVVMIILEDGLAGDSEHNSAASTIRNQLANYVYSPELNNNSSDGECRFLPLRSLTKGDVLAAGKQVILTAYEGCNNQGDWRNLVWELRNTGYLADEYVDAGDLRYRDTLSLIYEDRSIWGADLHCATPDLSDFEGLISDIVNGGPSAVDISNCIDGWELTSNEIHQALTQGVAIVGLDYGVEESRHEGVIWSWASSQPNGGTRQNCASRSGGGWQDSACSTTLKFACQEISSGRWAISPSTGTWSNGQSTCQALGNYNFTAPVNAQADDQMYAAALAAGATTLWINASDQNNEGQWVVHKHWHDINKNVRDGSTTTSSNAIQVYPFSVDHEVKRFNINSFGFFNTHVFLSAPSYHGSHPGVLQLNQLPLLSTSVHFQEWNYLDQTHTSEDFDLLPMPSGMRVMEDGSIWEVGSFTLSGTGEFKTVPFQYNFSKAPTLILTIQNISGGDTVTVRAKDVNTTTFKAALFEQESLMNGHNPLRVAYMAVQSDATESTIINAGGKNITYRVLTDTLDERWKNIGQYDYFLEEEQSKNDELDHTLETVNVLEIDGAAFIQQITSNGTDTTAIRRR